MALPAVIWLSSASSLAGAFTLAKDLHAAGIIGWPQMRFALTEIVPRVARHVHRIDHGALDEMVSLARSRVPVDTGRLLNGITGSVEGEYYVFRAQAARSEDDADYARFVEFGTQPGERGRKNALSSIQGFYSDPGHDPNDIGITVSQRVGFTTKAGQQVAFRAQNRVSYRSHPGTDPQPYFYSSASEVMDRRHLSMAALPDQAGQEAGF